MSRGVWPGAIKGVDASKLIRYLFLSLKLLEFPVPSFCLSHGENILVFFKDGI